MIKIINLLKFSRAQKTLLFLAGLLIFTYLNSAPQVSAAVCADTSGPAAVKLNVVSLDS